MSLSNNKDIFGCDIGNGFAFISVLKEVNDDPISMFPTKYKLESVGMPTSAYIKPPLGDIIEVFEERAACDKHKREYDKFIHAVKTRLKESTVEIPGINTPVDIDMVYATVVRDLIKLGNEERKNRGEMPIYEIVFTFPASFTDNLSILNRMQTSIESVKIDGYNLKVVGRLPEPAAVAIDYLYYMQNIVPSNIRIKGDSYTVLVYDLGHGTFDVAVVTARTKGEPFILHINEGLPDVGGKDFDNILYDEICMILKKDYGFIPNNNNMRNDIRNTAIKIKHELSDNSTGQDVINLPDGEWANIEITREKFEEKSKILINQTFELVDKVIQYAKKENIHIDSIVMSGGASQMPMVKSGLEQLLDGEDISFQMYRPSKSVSYGAARYAYGRSYEEIKPNFTSKSKPISKLITVESDKLKSSTSILEGYSEYSYGIWVPSENNLSGVVKVLVESKSKLPAVSDTITLMSSDSHMYLKLYRSKDKYVNNKILDVEKQCESIVFMPFDVPAYTECEIKIEVREDYNINIMCKPIGGTLIEKNTMDKFF